MLEGFHRRRLPHYNAVQATYFVTSCLAGSIPAVGVERLRQWAAERAAAVGTRRGDRGEPRQQDAFERQEEWLDGHSAVCWCEDRRCAAIVRDAMLHHAGEWYDLHAYVVMPSHIHCVLTPRVEWVAERRGDFASGSLSPRAAIMRVIKSYSARECNRVLGRTGPFWQAESYDRIVRNERELERFVRYVEFNPVKAGLCSRPEDWEFSSARTHGAW